MPEHKLTPAQNRAYELIKSKGKLFAYNGVSRATIRVLQSKGLVDVKWSVQTWTNYRSKRWHSECDWEATLTVRPGEQH